MKPEDKAKIEEKVKAGKELLLKTDAKKDEFDKFNEELSQILQVVGQAVYGQSGQAGPSAADGQPTAEEPAPTGKKSSKKDDKKDAEEGEVIK